MTPSPDREPVREGRKRRGGLFVNDTEICERLGVPEREGLRILKALDIKKDSGFPPKQSLWGDRRWWPAVFKYFERVYDIPATTERPKWDRAAAMRRAVNDR